MLIRITEEYHWNNLETGYQDDAPSQIFKLYVLLFQTRELESLRVGQKLTKRA